MFEDYEELPEIPLLPEIGSDDEENPCSFIRRIKEDSKYPPLIAPQSWTHTVSEKFSQQFYKPSETIGKCNIIEKKLLNVVQGRLLHPRLKNYEYSAYIYQKRRRLILRKIR